jgi:hypothetical protein
MANPPRRILPSINMVIDLPENKPARCSSFGQQPRDRISDPAPNRL